MNDSNFFLNLKSSLFKFSLIITYIENHLFNIICKTKIFHNSPVNHYTKGIFETESQWLKIRTKIWKWEHNNQTKSMILLIKKEKN